MNELNGPWIILIRHIKSVSVDVHITVSLKLKHVSHRLSLMRLYLFRVVVVLLSAKEHSE